MGGDTASLEAMFTPGQDAVGGSQLTRFMRFCAAETGLSFPDQPAFHDFSVAEPRTFWRLLLESAELPLDGTPEPVCTDDRVEHATFFPELRLNYAECLLSGGEDDAPALTAQGADGPTVRLTRGELRDRVRAVVAQLRKLGLEPGDRVAAVGGNGAEMVIAGLGCAAAGVTFSSAAPDMGTPALLSRFEQLAPKLLIASAALGSRTGEVAGRLATLKAVLTLEDLGAATAGEDGGEPWPRLPFNHPLFVLFTSGTTGQPKCIVHGAGGTLLEHLKEHRLHVDLRPGEKLFFHTTAAWMMWNWQLSALASGAEIVLYDGPIAGPETLWQVVADERVAVFGTSPPYLQLCEDSGFTPSAELDLAQLRAVLSTGSILHDWQYDWVAEHVGLLPLQSISGGTDIVGCFVLGSPNLPVHRGWVQCRSLGMDVQAEDGELVCRNPFPSRPTHFLGDPDGSRMHEAYFAQNPGVWTHGDLIELDAAGQARMHGRSDGVLNVNGIRLGPAEIYRALGSLAEVKEAMAVEHDRQLVLLVVLHEGARLDGRLVVEIRRAIARDTSPAHVPDLVAAVAALPVTHSGKRSERAARDALGGGEARNAEALANPESLDRIREAVDAAREARTVVPAADDSTAERLRAIWEEVLGISPLHHDDNFFELGGTSLAAVRLLEAVHRELGVDLSPSVLLDAPTIAEMAAAVEAPVGGSPLVRLREGREDRPLFLVHSLFGDVLSMRPLARLIDTDRAVYGLQARGLDPREQPHTRVEQMAEAYVESIRSLQPLGPYALGGHSLGGLVAFEMARRLLGDGAEVEWLGMVDSDLHHSSLTTAERLRWLRWKSGDVVRRGTADPRTRIPRFIRKGVLKIAPRAPVAMPARESSYPPLMRRLEDAGWAAFDAYRPGPYAGSVTFFRVEHRRDDMGDPLPVWRRVVEGRLTVEPVPGSHADIVAEPNVRYLAERFSAHLAG